VRFVRISALVAAVIVAAWFGLGVRQAHDLAAASATVTGSSPVSSKSAARVASLLSSASFFNPDSQVDILRARLALLQHDNRRALDILEPVVRREPLNLVAWVATAQAALKFDRAELAVAGRNIVRLDKSVK
jgi:hypothetical protein